MVSTIEPRKNHVALIEAWELLRTGFFPNLNLVIVGGLGWDHHSVLNRLTPWLGRGGVHLLQDVPTGDLRLLYRHAAITVCPSFGEGFDFSGVEAMASGGVVASSDLRVHREVFGDASAYFDPYSPVQMAELMKRMLSEEGAGEREILRKAGERVSALYRPSKVLPQWQSFLQGLADKAPRDR
jgi:glycosyltransferase involved in cell wall biosynthesis